MDPKFPTELARAVLAKAEADAQLDCGRQRYTQPQIAEIERRVDALRQAPSATSAAKG